jgi:hypothetical protein
MECANVFSETLPTPREVELRSAISAVIAVLAVALASPIASGAHGVTEGQADHRCHTGGQEMIYKNKLIAAFLDENSSAQANFYSVCWLATGKRRRVVKEPKESPRTEVNFVGGRDRWLFLQTNGADPIAMTVDGQTGRLGARVQISTAASCTSGNWPLVQPDTRNKPFGALAVGNHGEFAWQGVSCEPSGLESIYAPDGKGHDEVLDSAPQDVLHGLRVEEGVVSWYHGATRHQAHYAR